MHWLLGMFGVFNSLIYTLYHDFLLFSGLLIVHPPFLDTSQNIVKTCHCSPHYIRIMFKTLFKFGTNLWLATWMTKFNIITCKTYITIIFHFLYPPDHFAPHQTPYGNINIAPKPNHNIASNISTHLLSIYSLIHFRSR